MPSSYTPRNRLNLQATGENINLWGQILNAGGLELIDEAMDGVATISASGPTTLTTVNGADDQARYRVLNVTATGQAQITIPSVEKFYIVRAASADATITNGTASLIVKAGDCMGVVTDGVAIWPVRSTDFAGQRLKNIGTPQQSTDAVTKLYADGLAFAAALPAQTGNEGRYVTTDGATAFWAEPPSPTATQIKTALGYDPAAVEDIPTFATVAEVRAGNKTGKTIDPATLVDADSYIPVTASGAFTLDFSVGRKFKVTMTANSTMSITGLTKEISGVIRFQQDATGGRTLALNSAIKKVGPYTLSTAANAVDRCGVEICSGVAELTALEKGIA